jgi:diguanylate cyclase (GGDEF)-like protein
MPDLGGLDVIQRLKADPKAMATPVIFLTGENSGPAKARGFELGAVDYVTKPFEPIEFRARVKAALRTKELVDLLAQRAMIDGLTGLWNRRYFEERLSAETSLSERNGAPLSLVMLDVDHFKKINDTHGHPFGDEVLRAVARAASTRVRASDVFCRYGGEEFAVLLPNTDAPRAQTLAEDLRASIESLKLTKAKDPVPVTASFGVADRAPRQPPEALLQSADGALYDAKRGGRNKVMSRHGVGGLAKVA